MPGNLNSHDIFTEIDLREILEASHDGMFITDGKGVALMVSKGWERICGVSREFIIGKNLSDLVKRGWWTKSVITEAIEKNKKVTIMLEMTKGDKVGQKIMATGIPIWDNNGNIKRVIANVRDITEIGLLKEQLEKTQKLNIKYSTELEKIRLLEGKSEEFIATSKKSKQIIEMALQVAKVDSTVLITGESGVGKEVIAKFIHRLSDRANKPMIKLNCAAIPENLQESELFGYESGSFTGAGKNGKLGMFELANSGTLFLDEIGDISLNLQVKLLRVLQEREMFRVGGTKPIPVNIRIIAATNKNLADMVKLGKFREDLYYRLCVVLIEIPPLRERKEDLPALIMKFLEKNNNKYKLNKCLCSRVMQKLLDYTWPGNIRELENVIERMVVMTKDKNILIEHMPKHIRDYHVQSEGNIFVSNIMPLKNAVEQLEKKLIEWSMKEFKTTEKAAEVLKIDQSTVVRKIQKYNLKNSVSQYKYPLNP
jgi:PAS domain S-box-containing protein